MRRRGGEVLLAVLLVALLVWHACAGPLPMAPTPVRPPAAAP